MTSAINGLEDAEPISLAKSHSFSLGAMTVRPATREVLNADRREVLEPRVMEVFVVLAQAKGEVVTREHLIARCWKARAVTDDAINRVISRLRRLAQEM